MHLFRLGWKRCLTPLVLVAGAVFAQGGPSAQEVARIETAMPQRGAVAPVRPRKVLVFSISYGYWHTAIPYGKKAFDIMGEKTGAFEAVVSDDLAMFEPQNLRQFDAVIFNNTNGEVFLPADFDKLAANYKKGATEYGRALQESFASYLKDGGGLAAIHAAVACLAEWPEFGEIIGARFVNHPWGAGSTVTLRVEEPGHPLARAFEKPLFEITDEIYQVTDPYSRDKLRVLVSIDPDRTSVRLRDLGAVQRKDNDFGMTWIKEYGHGRVFYCALGHQHELFWNTMVLKHFLDGVQFAAGDIQCDATPSAK